MLFPRHYLSRSWRLACSVDLGGCMKLVMYALVMAILIASAAFGQQAVTSNGANPGGIQTGFLVVNPDAGAVQGLSVFETFGAQLGGNFVQSSVLSSPLVTLTDI